VGADPEQRDEFSGGTVGAARNYIGSLLDLNADTRLGSEAGDMEELKAHPFFDGFDWDDAAAKRIQPDWIPDSQDKSVWRITARGALSSQCRLDTIE
jgi:hypothetical protein